MNKNEARKILNNGGRLKHEVWTWTDHTYYCSEVACCFKSFSTIEDMVDHIESICGGMWEEVKEEL